VEKKKYVYWKEDEMWLGYLDEYPDYMTQGQTLDELRDNLRDIFKDLEGGKIPSARKVAELEVT
jgi:predicted RNase H-like HicB family nuclease